MNEFLLVGFIVGLILGIVLQRGSFCMYTAFANMVLTKDYRLIKALIWAFLLTMVAFHLMNDFGIAKLDPKPFFWIGSVLGAFLFAIGMVFAGGCIVGTPLKAASGKMGYWLTLLGMGSGGWLVIWGPLADFRKNVLQETSKILIKGSNPTITNLLGVNHWIIVIIISIFLIWLLIKLKNPLESKQEKEKDKKNIIQKMFSCMWSPLAIGIGLAIAEIIAFASGKSPSGLGGFIKGYAFYFKLLLTGKISFGWPVTEITGILLGVFISALISREFRIVWPKIVDIPRMYIGGLFMGIGAVVAAGGCNIAHILSHVTQFSLGSLVSSIVIVVTVVLLINILFLKSVQYKSNNKL